ncbi:MAG: BstXI family restriction endonuclease [Flavobacteriales bacterium]|nr:BstXI family restriction endonuclease [Flavobacteriales bacterium]MBK8947692.1 BstXI family restriction endonuclease [Flavobacteriales bacterium]MBK9700431.1 BstXI family restriction endonuclease [Flavobacteriales bacterium]
MAKKSIARIPALPQLLKDKIYKTGQTRGASNNEVYQNRVLRNNTVLIRYNRIDIEPMHPSGAESFENGYIVLISPETYFGTPDVEDVLLTNGLVLGENALVFYESRAQWQAHDPTSHGWVPADSRQAPLGGQYVARVPGSTSGRKAKPIYEGFNHKDSKGAGIRVYEYADSRTLELCKMQLEAIFWHCHDALAVTVSNGMSEADADRRKSHAIEVAIREGLLDYNKLREVRILNANDISICPLCLEPLSAQSFFNRMEQAEGREVLGLTITQVNLFHVNELRVGIFNHRAYNLGWGHHKCNVVVGDEGIEKTLKWMREVIGRNEEAGLLPTE